MTISGPPPSEMYWQSQHPQHMSTTGGNGNNLLVPPPLQSQILQGHSPNPYGMMNQDPNLLASIPADQYGDQIQQHIMGYQEAVQDMGYTPNPHGQTQGQGQVQGQAGRYVFQADGSQIYLPYSYDQ